jgi:hypothetical protein
MEYGGDSEYDYGESDNDDDLHSDRDKHNDRMLKHYERNGECDANADARSSSNTNDDLCG